MERLRPVPPDRMQRGSGRREPRVLCERGSSFLDLDALGVDRNLETEAHALGSVVLDV
jgi:hypothetical protein